MGLNRKLQRIEAIEAWFDELDAPPKSESDRRPNWRRARHRRSAAVTRSSADATDRRGRVVR